jgi:hypothetical protein
MLKDPRWDKTPSMAGFALFVASKNPKERYNWRNCQECAVGLYLESIGQYCDAREWTGVLNDMNDIARGCRYYYESDWTFGKLADRILAHQMATG